MPTVKLETGDYSASLKEGSLGARLRELADDPTAPDRPALVIQGGGLRGVYSMAALAVLEEHRLRDAFSMVVGSSAGAINGAYFLAGQASESIAIYTEYLSTKRFVCPYRLWRIVDVDHMVDLLKLHHPLNTTAMGEAPLPLYTILTEAMTAEEQVISNRERGIDPYELFRATAALPALYNRKVPIQGRAYVDGGLAGLVPLEQARSLGAKEAVVLLTRLPGHRKDDCGPILRVGVNLMARGQSTAIRRRICAADSAYNAEMNRLDDEILQSPRQTWTLRPTRKSQLVNRTTNNRQRLLDCASLAREDTLNLLAQSYAVRKPAPPRPS